MRGFSAQNLWRMRQLYLAYERNEKLSPLVREIGWSHNIIILIVLIRDTSIKSSSFVRQGQSLSAAKSGTDSRRSASRIELDALSHFNAG